MTVLGEELTDLDAFIRSERSRSDCYRLLSACFYQPVRELFIEEGLLRNLVSALRTVCPEAAGYADTIEEAYARYNDEELLVEYARLFVGPNELLAAPYGSVYLEKERRVMGESTLETIKMYQEEGLTIDSDFRELPDHITVELEFMYYLIAKEIEALARNEVSAAHQHIKKQEHFMNSFLGRWTGQFCEKINENTKNDFYRTLADCTAVFIRNELRRVNAAKLPHI
ncbi:MAG: molecular chaperone TorD family protein [Nitrospirota bacterium]